MVSNHPSSAQMMGMLVSRHEWFKLGSKLSGLSWGVSWEKVGWKLGRKLTTLLARVAVWWWGGYLKKGRGRGKKKGMNGEMSFTLTSFVCRPGNLV